MADKNQSKDEGFLFIKKNPPYATEPVYAKKGQIFVAGKKSMEDEVAAGRKSEVRTVY